MACVYHVCMARINVYLPDDLAENARRAGLNVSALTQSAIAAELRRRDTNTWLAQLPTPVSTVSHQASLRALDEARAEFTG
jgi:post-segregation antitoxin (ccd killing protein)